MKLFNKKTKPKQQNSELIVSDGSRVWYRYNVDRPLMLIILSLVAIGTVMVFSASYAYAEMWYDDSYFFARKQILWVALGLVAMFAASKFNVYNLIYKYTKIIFFAVVLLNFAVPLWGIVSHGAKRWIEIGIINLQPSELLKFSVILMFAYLTYNLKKDEKLIIFLVKYGILIGGCALATVLQSHLSATIIITTLALFMMFLGGVKIRRILLMLLIGLLAVLILFAFFSPFLEDTLGHAELRIKVWSDPFKYMKDAETNDAGWQPAQSLYAISSGGLWGVGLSQSNEKHGWLPEPQNDYIFSILCEELGFFAAVLVIGLFAALVWRGFVVAKRAPDDFSRMIIMGITLQIAIQAALNIAVVTNSIPSTGISLPFISYGGTSLVMLLGECGIMLSFSRYTTEERTALGVR